MFLFLSLKNHHNKTNIRFPSVDMTLNTHKTAWLKKHSLWSGLQMSLLTHEKSIK